MEENYNLDPQLGSWTDLQEKLKTARLTALGVILLTVVNMLFALFGEQVQLLYAMTAPYYFVVFGKAMDNRFTMGKWTQTGVYTRTGLVMAVAILAVLLLCWFFSKKRIKLLWVILIAAILDTVALLALNVLLGGMVGGILDVLIHGFFIWQMISGLKAAKKLEKKRQSYGAEPYEEKQNPEDILG